jgi:SAM-dependent methyltransferase
MSIMVIAVKGFFRNERLVNADYLACYYDDRTARAPTDLLKQVGHTESGEAISIDMFDRLVEDIALRLDLSPGDDLLDLCCGNGVFTARLASRARSAFGVDFSAGLIDVARSQSSAPNTRFEVADVRRLPRLTPDGDGKFPKVMMYAALQHFPNDSLAPLLGDILALTTDDPVILIGFVPERSRRFAFYDSWPRRLTYLSRKLVGKDVMGSWWNRTDFERAGASHGLTCSFHPIAEGTRARDYRFDAVFRKRV